MTYLKRNLEDKIERLLALFPVVMLTGARQTGKTTLGRNIRPDWHYFDLEKGLDYDFITQDYGFFFKEYPEHIIIDEAQESPQLFRELRGIIDANRSKKGRFILTGSSSSELLKQASDSLAGRIAIIDIGTFKMNEILRQPLPAFYQLFCEVVTLDSLTVLKNLDCSIDDVIALFFRGGYPEPVLYDEQEGFDLWMENYFQTYINRDIKKLFPKLDDVRYRRFIRMLSALSGTIINKAQLGRSVDVSEVTIRDYLEIADKTFVWRTIPSFENGRTKSVVKMPKGLIRDSGLNHYLAGIENRKKLLHSPQIGQNFESFIIEEIIKGIQATNITRCDYYYYRTRNGAEIDLVLEGRFGIVPIEIKLGQKTTLRQLTALRQFVDIQQLPLGIVINTSTEVRMLSEKIIQIPAGCL